MLVCVYPERRNSFEIGDDSLVRSPRADQVRQALTN